MTPSAPLFNSFATSSAIVCHSEGVMSSLAILKGDNIDVRLIMSFSSGVVVRISSGSMSMWTAPVL